VTPDPLTIGWRERVDLPDWGVRRLLAKADTGARTSAVHAERIERLPNGRVAFDVVYSRAHPEHSVRVEAPIVREAHVRSSSGEGGERLFVSTRLRIGAFEREVEMTLISRELMSCRMLIGRTAMAGRLVVDPTREYLLTPTRKAKRKDTP